MTKTNPFLVPNGFSYHGNRAIENSPLVVREFVEYFTESSIDSHRRLPSDASDGSGCYVTENSLFVKLKS